MAADIIHHKNKIKVDMEKQGYEPEEWKLKQDQVLKDERAYQEEYREPPGFQKEEEKKEVGKAGGKE